MLVGFRVFWVECDSCSLSHRFIQLRRITLLSDLNPHFPISVLQYLERTAAREVILPPHGNVSSVEINHMINYITSVSVGGAGGVWRTMSFTVD